MSWCKLQLLQGWQPRSWQCTQKGCCTMPRCSTGCVRRCAQPRQALVTPTAMCTAAAQPMCSWRSPGIGSASTFPPGPMSGIKMLLKALDLLTGEALIVWHCLQHQTPLAVVACCGVQMTATLWHTAVPPDSCSCCTCRAWQPCPTRYVSSCAPFRKVMYVPSLESQVSLRSCLEEGERQSSIWQFPPLQVLAPA